MMQSREFNSFWDALNEPIEDLKRQLDRLSRQASRPEPVVARYDSNTQRAILHGVGTILDYEDQEFDPWSAVTVGASWKFTTPLPGYYLVIAALTCLQSANWGANEYLQFNLYKNGSQFALLDFRYPHTGDFAVARGSDIILLAAGDYIDIRIVQVSGGTINTTGNPVNNYVSIAMVG